MNASAPLKTLWALATCCSVLRGAATELLMPPPMPRRVIAPSTNELRGTQLSLEDRGVKFTLYLPNG